MKKRLLVFSIVVLALLLVSSAPMAIAGGGGKKNGCTTIQDGTLLASTGEPIVLGYDQFGYNYQAYMFNGRYCDYDRVAGGDYCDVDLIMKWSDTWLSNKDCNEDEKLDRGYVDCRGAGTNPNLTDSHCPGAWLTNHQKGEYELDGKICKWTYFVKIVYVVPEGDLWGAFTVIQSVYNDPCDGFHGIELLSQPAGFGAYNK